MSENSSGTHCKHYVVRKKRYCRIAPQPGQEFCGEHQEIQPDELHLGNNEKPVRIVCPLDRKHTCYAHKLKKHLKICNAREKQLEDYISKNFNSGNVDTTQNISKLLSEFTTQEILNVIAKVNKIFEEQISGNITEKFSKCDIVETEMQKPEYGPKTKKHLIQASAVIGLLNDYHLLNNKTCYVEFGAGRGQLTYWIAKVKESDSESNLLLIERASPKHKHDNKLGKNNEKIQRIRADIADLVLDKVDVISKVENIVGVAKHLCGEATDLALRCLINIDTYKDKIKGAIMTFCCHHRCRWGSYLGREFFEANHLTKTDFDIICGIASWATCGDGFSRERRKHLKDPPNDRNNEYNLNREEKEEVGRRCKSIINWGRLIYLKKLNFKCFLHYYVEKSISLENVCIVFMK